MQQRQLRLGDILDDYCPRERRLTNHAVVAMVGPEVKQTRCTTCDTEHEYKHAKVPRQRRKDEGPAALYSQVLTGARKRAHVEPAADGELPESDSGVDHDPVPEPVAARPMTPEVPESHPDEDLHGDEVEDVDGVEDHEEGPVHRPLIRATLPRQEGQPPAARPAPDFTIRQPGGRSNRFRPRHGGGQLFGNRTNGNVGPMRSGPRQGGRPPMPSRPPKRHDGGGRKRSK